MSWEHTINNTKCLPDSSFCLRWKDEYICERQCCRAQLNGGARGAGAGEIRKRCEGWEGIRGGSLGVKCWSRERRRRAFPRDEQLEQRQRSKEADGLLGNCRNLVGLQKNGSCEARNLNENLEGFRNPPQGMDRCCVSLNNACLRWQGATKA